VGSTPGAAGAVGAGAAVVSSAGGIALGLLAQSAADDAVAAVDAAVASRHYADATNLALGANVVWVAAAAAGVVGAACLVTGLSVDDDVPAPR
jgi:hypothetical protein